MTNNTLAKLAASQRKDAVFSAALDFMGELTGMVPPPIEIAPPEVFKPFRDFTEKVCAIFDAALTAHAHGNNSTDSSGTRNASIDSITQDVKAQALPAAEPVAFIQKSAHESELVWSKDEELEGLLYDYEPLYTAPQAAQQAAQPAIDAVTEGPIPAWLDEDPYAAQAPEGWADICERSRGYLHGSTKGLLIVEDDLVAIGKLLGDVSWVSTEDRLPEVGQQVLFIVKSGDAFYHGRLLGGTFGILAGMPGFSTPGVTYGASHWMPAPPPPAARPQPPQPDNLTSKSALKRIEVQSQPQSAQKGGCMTLGELFKQRRKAQGKKMQDVSDLCGIAPGHLFHLENDSHKNPGIYTCIRVAVALGIPFQEVADTVLAVRAQSAQPESAQ